MGHNYRWKSFWLGWDWNPCTRSLQWLQTWELPTKSRRYLLVNNAQIMWYFGLESYCILLTSLKTLNFGNYCSVFIYWWLHCIHKTYREKQSTPSSYPVMSIFMLIKAVDAWCFNDANFRERNTWKFVFINLPLLIKTLVILTFCWCLIIYLHRALLPQKYRLQLADRDL